RASGLRNRRMTGVRARLMASNATPSPGGEGRGEGGRFVPPNFHVSPVQGAESEFMSLDFGHLIFELRPSFVLRHSGFVISHPILWRAPGLSPSRRGAVCGSRVSWRAGNDDRPATVWRCPIGPSKNREPTRPGTPRRERWFQKPAGAPRGRRAGRIG